MDSIVIEEPSSSSSSTIFEVEGDSGGGGGRAIDRHNPIIRDEKRLGRQGYIFPYSSSTASTITITSTTSTADDQARHDGLPNVTPEVDDTGDQKRKSAVYAAKADDDDEVINPVGDFISPESSSRFLLRSTHDKPTFNYSSDDQLSRISQQPQHRPVNSHKGNNAYKSKDDHHYSDSLPSSSPPPKPLIINNNNNSKASKHGRDWMFSAVPKSPLATRQPSPPPSSHQVVVLEVSLHCRGCERKMKKHISKIEGVKSFKIEFAAKKVTVVGDVTPLAVLTSVLKVKNAKLLTPATISS